MTKLSNTEGRRTTCASARDELYDHVLEKSGTDVVLLAQLQRLPSDPDRLNLARPPGDDRPVTTVRDLMVESTDATLSEIEAQGVRALVLESIWLPPPEMGNPLDCLASARRVEQCRVAVRPRSELMDSLYLAADARSDDIFTADLNPIMCPSAPVCDAMLGRIPVWRDSLHYSPGILESRSDQVWDAFLATGAFEGLDPLT